MREGLAGRKLLSMSALQLPTAAGVILRGFLAHDYKEDKVEGVEPKVEAEIRRCVAEIAEKRYPRVWVGEAGITTEELLHLQEINEEVPDWLRRAGGALRVRRNGGPQLRARCLCGLDRRREGS